MRFHLINKIGGHITLRRCSVYIAKQRHSHSYKKNSSYKANRMPTNFIFKESKKKQTNITSCIIAKQPRRNEGPESSRIYTNLSFTTWL